MSLPVALSLIFGTWALALALLPFADPDGFALPLLLTLGSSGSVIAVLCVR